jgi:hypothetical protein
MRLEEGRTAGLRDPVPRDRRAGKKEGRGKVRWGVMNFRVLSCADDDDDERHVR